MKLFKAEIVNTVCKYDRAISEIDQELNRRHAALWRKLACWTHTLPEWKECSSE